MVFVTLNAPSLPERTADGLVRFRGAAAVVLRGPATVRLAFPFRVEPLPIDPDNYWDDLRISCAQFGLPFDCTPSEPPYPREDGTAIGGDSVDHGDVDPGAETPVQEPRHQPFEGIDRKGETVL